MLHRYALAAKSLPLTLKEILSYCVKMVNFIRSRFINHRLFNALCRELGSDHEVLLCHSEVRWLSRGEILERLQKLKEEVSLFLKNKNSPFAEKSSLNHFCTACPTWQIFSVILTTLIVQCRDQV